MLLVKPHNKTNQYNKFIKYLPDKKELKAYFKNLCNYLHVPYGEGQGMQFNLNLKDFLINQVLMKRIREKTESFYFLNQLSIKILGRLIGY